MKADREGVEVSLSYGSARGNSKKFALTTDWARYEIAVTNSPGRGVLPNTTIVFPKTGEGTIWIDDVQVTGGKLANGGFETLKNGAPASWRMGRHKEKAEYSSKLIVGKAAEGQNC